MKSIKKWSFTQVMVFGFLALILVGACILMLPICNANGKWLNFPDALFTSCTYCLCDRTSNCCPGISVYISGKVGHAVFNSSRRLGRYCLCDVCACSYESQTHHSGTRDAAKLF